MLYLKHVDDIVIKLAINLDALVIQIVVSTVVIAPSLWIAGRVMVGKEKALLTDAVWIVAAGTVLGAILQALFSGRIAGLAQSILWLYLIKEKYETGWGTSLVITLLTVIVFIGIGVVLGILGFGINTIF